MVLPFLFLLLSRLPFLLWYQKGKLEGNAYRKEHAGAKFQGPVKITPLSRRFGNGPSYRCDMPVGTRGYFWLQCDA